MTITCPQLGHQGRLGNQLFQLAATLGIADTQGESACLPDDWSYRQWFNLPHDLFGNCSGTPADHYATHIDERARPYLQDHNLFAGIMPMLREYLKPSIPACELLEPDYWGLPRPILTVHVRRGDNVPGADPGHPVDKHLYHPCPPLEYYERAMAAVYEISDGPASIAVFGDDPEWNARNIPGDYHHHGVVRAKEHLPEYHTEPALDFIDWLMLADADLHVCSNSTYGVFAALIAGGPAIVPSPFFGPALSYIDSSLLFPSTWKQVQY